MFRGSQGFCCSETSVVEQTLTGPTSWSYCYTPGSRFSVEACWPRQRLSSKRRPSNSCAASFQSEARPPPITSLDWKNGTRTVVTQFALAFKLLDDEGKDRSLNDFLGDPSSHTPSDRPLFWARIPTERASLPLLHSSSSSRVSTTIQNSRS